MSFGFLADLFGRRPTIVFYNIGAVASGLVLYLVLGSYAYYPYMLVIFGYFVFGVFSGHAIYLPELFPTRARNGGRVLQRHGALITSFDRLSRACWWCRLAASTTPRRS
jgi:MFS family permease